MTTMTILRAGPLTTLQDRGRFGMLRYGISASGPMDRTAFATASAELGRFGRTALEHTQGLRFSVDGPLRVAFPEVADLAAGDEIEIPPPPGNYGYVRFDRDMALSFVLGSTSTNVTVGLGGHEGRALRQSDRIAFSELATGTDEPIGEPSSGPFRIMWGLHAAHFPATTRLQLPLATFRVTNRLDRMGVTLDDTTGLFRDSRQLSLVSDAIVPGDIQILGDGTPIVLMRDHQPTGGYPRIATIIDEDLDRFAQVRPGGEIRFQPVAR